jgi:hypothetical protein
MIVMLSFRTMLSTKQGRLLSRPYQPDVWDINFSGYEDIGFR